MGLLKELSWKECIDRCLQSEECLSVTYTPSDGSCYRKVKAFNESESKQTRFSLISMNMECLTGKMSDVQFLVTVTS